MNHDQLPPPVQLMKFVVGKWISKPIYAAAEFGIADILAEGPKSIEEIAQITKTHAPSLKRVMRALASVGIFSETKDSQYELTPMAECLKTGAMRSIALMFNSDWNEKAWTYFTDSIRTGETPFERAHGMPISGWLENNHQAAKMLGEANALKAANSHRAIVDVYDFSGINTLTDVGGGFGVLMAEILSANSFMKGIVAELPLVVQAAKETIRAREMEDRCEVVECDFFRQIPVGADAYLMSHILHDWKDEECRVILKNCHDAMKPGSKLLIVEMIIPPGNEPSIVKLLDLEMFVITGGRERTEDEFRYLLESSGFELSRIIPTKESICVIEGIRR
ncbi:MAG: methyltransferase [Desulfobacterales bacterium]|nr:methyltransferase [Desulfobacterales bacterium]